MQKRIISSLQAIIFISILIFSNVANAQSTGQPKVHLHETPPPQQVTTSGGALGLSLQSSFSLLDGEDQVLMAFEIVDATYDIEGESYTAVLQELEVPWTVIYLIDTSKTLGGFSTGPTFKNVKNILATSVEAIPDNSNIAVMSFANGAPTALEFTQDTEAATTAIRNLAASGSGNSCMNDGLYEAVNKLGGAPGRKAVILFTASADDCARRTAQEVVDFAQQNQVQIYPVGLQGYSITKDELDSLAGPTGGVAELRDESALSFGLSNVIGLLMNQWTAKATVYPSAGEVAATLTVNLSDNTSITSPEFIFNSSQDYIPPAEIEIKGLVQSVAEGILFNLNIRQRDKIRQLNVSVTSIETGQSVVSQSLITFSDVNTVPTASLIPGSKYTLMVSAMDSGGQILSEDSAEFEYQPPAANLTVADIQTPSPEQDEFVVTVAAQNISGVVKYKAWFGDGETRAKIPSSEVTIPLGDPILIPAEDIRSGNYLVIVQALDGNDTVLAETPAMELIYKRPGIFQTFPNWVSTSPFAITAVTGICCLSLIGILAIIWMVLPKKSEKSSDVDLIFPQKERRPVPPAPRPSPPPRPKDDIAMDADQEAAYVRQPPKAPPIPPVSPERPVDDAPDDQPAAMIILLQPKELEFTAEMRDTPFTIGRKKDNDAVLPVDSSSGVSGNHLVLSFAKGGYYVKDENSTYGTFVDGEAVEKGKPTLLKDGSVISLGPKVKVNFQLIIED
jgi:hypothetical protein